MLSSEAIRKLIETRELVTGYVDLDKQLQPAGFDLSIREIQSYAGGGRVDFTNEERILAPTAVLAPDPQGWYNLTEGSYLVTYNETIKMPLDLVALARSRSTVLRNGATVETAVWDPGYHGRSSSLLVVHNHGGIRLKQNARIVQLLFLGTDEVKKGYNGMYQNERTRENRGTD